MELREFRACHPKIHCFGSWIVLSWVQIRPSRLRRSPFLSFEQFGLLQCRYPNLDAPPGPSSFRTNLISLPHNNPFHSWRPKPVLQLLQAAGFCAPSPPASFAQQPLGSLYVGNPGASKEMCFLCAPCASHCFGFPLEAGVAVAIAPRTPSPERSWLRLWIALLGHVWAGKCQASGTYLWLFFPSHSYFWSLEERKYVATVLWFLCVLEQTTVGCCKESEERNVCAAWGALCRGHECKHVA